MRPSVRGFLSAEGTITRGRYLLLGVLLFAIKYNIDRVVAAAFFNRKWSLFDYWVRTESLTIAAIPREQIPFYLALLLIAIIFIWLGIVLTVRRLRDAGLPVWLVVLFYVPVVNLFFFLLLSLLPSQTAVASANSNPLSLAFERVLPHSKFGSAMCGLGLTIFPALIATQLGVSVLENYGWGIFVGIPFFLGLTSVLIYGFHQARTFAECLVVATLAVALFGGALTLFAVEGFICILMAAPIGLALAVFGAGIAYLVQLRPIPKAEAPRLYSVMFLAVPLLMLMETADAAHPTLVPVRTSVEINAPPERVWQHVVSFSELPPPQSWLFQAGIAYPVRAEIKGTGVGAIRRCIFSTGAFVEPIEVWDEPRLLKFSVTEQPPAMRELSPYGAIKAPHLDDYLVSRGGQFLLTPLPGGRTRLEGTTWYEVRIFPEKYWQVWSDGIIHRIHLRVLNHVKQLAEEDEDQNCGQGNLKTKGNGACEAAI